MITEQVTDEKEMSQLQKNKMIGNFVLENSTIDFWGNGNILYGEGTVHLKNTHIQFRGNDSLIFLGKTKDRFSLSLTLYHQSVCLIGKNTYIHSNLHISVSERQNVWIGNGCLLSFGTWIRTADPHLIYENTSKKRINLSQSVFIGDHVWIGQDCLLLKGTQIGSGTIIGGHSVISGKKIPSNTSYAGNPVRLIKENVFFTRESVHDFLEEDTEESMYCDTDDYIFEKDDSTLSFDKIDQTLKSFENVDQKLHYLMELTSKNIKNRFYIS